MNGPAFYRGQRTDCRTDARGKLKAQDGKSLAPARLWITARCQRLCGTMPISD
ncbi:hypothetical protein PPGU16_80450 (plasmid) [Paraburkholderia largidicola]|uniref:Uncharacterized protein n=1 Tax=Paraburkholderia largidicola TaxID=3014751 RepID=A0A7I8C3J6_9BURK|nr:hypothetical protein PPGU16_80450 [Paraburkholderia sp. PGU16]